MRRSAKIVLAWMAASLWGAFIWGLGGDDFAMQSTSRLLGPLVAWLLPSAEPETRALVEFAIRKLAHLVEYAVFALLVGNAIRITWEPRMRVIVPAALAAVLALALADEFRQGFSAVRSGSLSDVALDLSGGALAIALLFALKRVRGGPLFGTAVANSAPAPAEGAEDPTDGDGARPLSGAGA